MEKINAQEYIEKNYLDTVEALKRSLCYLKDSDLRKKIEEYFYKECEKANYERDSVRSLKSSLTNSIKQINTPALEYDIEYLLIYFEQDFRMLFYALSSICMKVNIVLADICASYLKYCGKNDLKKVEENLFMAAILDIYEEQYGSEARQVFEDVLDTEKDLIQKGYEKARQGKTFCETCAPFCWIQRENSKTKYKRTVPFRY